jgi:hypothetical protein
VGGQELMQQKPVGRMQLHGIVSGLPSSSGCLPETPDDLLDVIKGHFPGHASVNKAGHGGWSDGFAAAQVVHALSSGVVKLNGDFRTLPLYNVNNLLQSLDVVILKDAQL